MAGQTLAETQKIAAGGAGPLTDLYRKYLIDTGGATPNPMPEFYSLANITTRSRSPTRNCAGKRPRDNCRRCSKPSRRWMFAIRTSRERY